MKKFITISIIVILLALTIGGYFLFFATYSSGYRVGTIIKMSKRGIIFKTNEGQLHTGGVTAGGDGELASSIWDFSVSRGNEPILQAISDASIDQNRVKLLYDEKFYQWSFFGDTKYFITGVEILKPKNTPTVDPLVDEAAEDHLNNENTLF